MRRGAPPRSGVAMAAPSCGWLSPRRAPPLLSLARRPRHWGRVGGAGRRAQLAAFSNARASASTQQGLGGGWRCTPLGPARPILTHPPAPTPHPQRARRVTAAHQRGGVLAHSPPNHCRARAARRPRAALLGNTTGARTLERTAGVQQVRGAERRKPRRRRSLAAGRAIAGLAPRQRFRGGTRAGRGGGRLAQASGRGVHYPIKRGAAISPAAPHPRLPPPRARTGGSAAPR